MSFQMKCPFCGQLIGAEEEWVGMDATCPGCNQTIKIAHTEASAAPQAPFSPAPPTDQVPPYMQQGFQTMPEAGAPEKSGFRLGVPILIAIVAVVVIGLAGWFIFNGSSSSDSDEADAGSIATIIRVAQNM